MTILGIDWGQRKVGVAWSAGKLSQPIEVIHYEHTNKLFRRLKEIVEDFEIEKIVVGVSEASSGVASNNFAKVLENELNLPVETYDETLSSQDAQRLGREAGKARKKRKEMEDAYAAAIMLQNYLDSL